MSLSESLDYQSTLTCQRLRGWHKVTYNTHGTHLAACVIETNHALEAEGLLTTETEYIGKRVRKYYSLTPTGKSKSKERVSELAEFMETMRFLLDIKPATT